MKKFHSNISIIGRQRSKTSRKAMGLIGQLEIIIFKEAVHEDDELAHAGGHEIKFQVM